MKLSIYDVEEKEGKNGKYILLETSLGNVFCFPNDFEGDFDTIINLKDKEIDGGVTAGEYQRLRVVKEVLGSAKKRDRPIDKQRIISRVACVNSAIKMIDVGKEEVSQSKVPVMTFEMAERIFAFINK